MDPTEDGGSDQNLESVIIFQYIICSLITVCSHLSTISITGNKMKFLLPTWPFNVIAIKKIPMCQNDLKLKWKFYLAISSNFVFANKFQEKQRAISDLETTIKSSSYSAIRNCIGSGRYVDRKDEILNVKKSKGCFIILHDGDHYTFGGHGQLVDDFIKTRMLKGICEIHEPIARVDDENYDVAPIRMVKFDEAYDTVSYDARKREQISE